MKKSIIFIIVLFLFLITACNSKNSTVISTENLELITPSYEMSKENILNPVALNLKEIDLITAKSDVGLFPFFEWEPVESAIRYNLLLIDKEGRAYWAWEGSENSIYLGGYYESPAHDSSGPILYEKMSWYILAFDSNNQLIASSVRQEISPK